MHIPSGETSLLDLLPFHVALDQTLPPQQAYDF